MKFTRTKATGKIILTLGAGVLCAASAAVLAATPQDPGAAKNAAQSVAPNAAADSSTSLNDQTDLAVTVYNSNIALVRDVRQLQLPGGTFRLKFMDIAATVN